MQTQSIGEIIKRFREREGISQMKLEMDIGASAGVISRIEKGKVNPTKETLKKIADKLDLTLRERSYLYGDYDETRLQEDVTKARKEIDEYFQKPGVYAYILDERYRVWYLSSSFVNMLNLPQELVESLYGINLLQIIFDNSLGLPQIFHNDNYEEMARNELIRFKKEVPFWDIDIYMLSLVNLLKSKSELFAKCLLDRPNEQGCIYQNENKDVYFKIQGKKVKGTFLREYLNSNARFVMVNYNIEQKL